MRRILVEAPPPLGNFVERAWRHARLADLAETCSYAVEMTRMVQCAKLKESLPGLPYKPFSDALGQRIYDTVSADAWKLWIEHSKKLVNEYRMDLTLKKTHDVLKEQCEQFLFGDGPSMAAADYVPEGHEGGHKH